LAFMRSQLQTKKQFGFAPRGVIYWLPTKGDMNDFVDTKVDPLIRENEDLALNTATSIEHVDNKGLKFIYGIPTYWRGIESKSGVKSISGDADIFDEYDEAPPQQVKQAEKRTSASLVKYRRRLSTPTIPDYGINKVFQETDQMHFSIICQGCHEHNVLEENFPNCFRQDKLGDWFHACSKCKSKLDVSIGQWIRKYNNPMRGYQISQLYSPFVSANEIMREYQTTEFMDHFYSHVLGRPYLNATDRVTETQVLALCNNLKPMPTEFLSPTVMGIDQGASLHCVIFQPTSNRVVWIITQESEDEGKEKEGVHEADSLAKHILQAKKDLNKKDGETEMEYEARCMKQAMASSKKEKEDEAKKEADAKGKDGGGDGGDDDKGKENEDEKKEAADDKNGKEKDGGGTDDKSGGDDKDPMSKMKKEMESLKKEVESLKGMLQKKEDEAKDAKEQAAKLQTEKAIKAKEELIDKVLSESEEPYSITKLWREALKECKTDKQIRETAKRLMETAAQVRAEEFQETSSHGFGEFKPLSENEPTDKHFLE